MGSVLRDHRHEANESDAGKEALFARAKADIGEFFWSFPGFLVRESSLAGFDDQANFDVVRMVEIMQVIALDGEGSNVAKTRVQVLNAYLEDGI